MSSGTESDVDLVIIGGGIVGLSTALEASRRYPDLKISVVEAEDEVARHQSGHNSGVIHSGIYYKPGSDRALLCRSGKALMEAFCEENRIKWDRCGKVVVATNGDEIERLDVIAERAKQNGVEFERIDTDQLREIEPHAAGIAALHVPETGIVNYAKVCNAIAELLRSAGATIHFGFQVRRISTRQNRTYVQCQAGRSIGCDRIINCAGLQSDRVCRLAGIDPEVQIVPFRGEYYELETSSEHHCRNLIYPVPDPSFPFLGVHFTRMIDGGVECGPNAVLALSRSGYSWSNLKLADLFSTLAYSGFRRLASKHWRTGMGEIHRSLSKNAFVAALQHLIPSIKASDLKRGRAGVRAQAVSKEGNLLDDFCIRQTDRGVHVLNAPSPAATASLAIAQRIVDFLQ